MPFYKFIKKRRPSTKLDLQGVPTLQLNSTILAPIQCPTNIMSTLTAPFYEVYTIDPSGALFGQTTYPCIENAWKKYLVNYKDVYSCYKY